MTVVEFFDGVSIENMASCLAIRPEKIIFIGEKKPMKKQEEIYRRFIFSYGLDAELDYRPINKNSVEQIVSVLIEIVENERNCVFDLTGGEDLVLVAMGMVFERYAGTGKVLMHRFNIRTGAIYDCDNDGTVPELVAPALSVKDNIMLYGGRVAGRNGKGEAYNWTFDEEFESDLKVLWEICKESPGVWNSQIGTIAFMAKKEETDTDLLGVTASKAHMKEFMKSKNRNFIWLSAILKVFNTYGFITDLEDNERLISFRFKNEQIRTCLTEEGTLLELMVLLFAKKSKGGDGLPVYDDAVNGVHIKWDPDIHDISDDEKDIENEIDVILMKGLVPIFVSCKNGYVDESELYKLNTVAERFGGPYAKKVLVMTYYGRNNTEAYKYFVQRAKDMKIQIIDNVDEMSQENFAKRIKNIVC